MSDCRWAPSGTFSQSAFRTATKACVLQACMRFGWTPNEVPLLNGKTRWSETPVDHSGKDFLLHPSRENWWAPCSYEAQVNRAVVPAKLRLGMNQTPGTAHSLHPPLFYRLHPPNDLICYSLAPSDNKTFWRDRQWARSEWRNNNSFSTEIQRILLQSCFCDN